MRPKFTLEVKGQLATALMNPTSWITKIDDVFQKLDGHVIAEYKKEVPVNNNFLRGAVRKQEKGVLEFKVGTDVLTKSGKSYPKFIHGGTGKLKGARDFGYTTGRVRAGDVARGIGGIRPNKFADRATKTAEPIFFKQFIKQVARINKETQNVKL